MKYKNYYKILELNTSHATDEEIKIAYRRLAKKYHPDINPGDDVAIEKFKAINEAYQVLSDESSKKKFDRIHNIYKVKDTFNDTKEKFNAEGVSEMFNIMFGKDNGSLNKKPKKDLSVTGEDVNMQITISIEDAFWGTEKKIVCKSSEEKMKKISVSIPRGIKNGDKIRVEGQGKLGVNGAPNGDLYIKVVYEDNKRYKIIDDDIYMNLELTPWEAALGTRLYIENIDSSVQVDVPSGTESGETLLIPEKGFWNKDNGRGNLVLKAKIMIPKNLSDSEALLFKRFSEISQYNPRVK